MPKPATRVTTPVSTISFPQLFEAKAANPKDDPKFSATIIFDEGQDLSTLDAAIEAAIEKAIEKKWNGKRPKDLKLPFKNGDEKLDKEDNPRPEFAGRTYITVNATADDQPKVVGEDREPIIDVKEMYGGARVRVALSAYGWTYGKDKGVSFYLNAVQKVADGEPFGLNVSIDEDFA